MLTLFQLLLILTLVVVSVVLRHPQRAAAEAHDRMSFKLILVLRFYAVFGAAIILVYVVLSGLSSLIRSLSA